MARQPPVPADLSTASVSTFMREIAASAGLDHYLGPVLEMTATRPQSQKPPGPLGSDAQAWQPMRPP